MDRLKKGTLVFVHTQSYPPWPAQIQRKYQNGLYKVNFIGEKSYTRIEQDKIDLFTEERARQIHSELEDKKLSKAIFVALKQFQNRRKRGQFDQQLSQLLKKNLPPLDLSMYKNIARQQSNNYKPFPTHFSLQGISKYLPSSSTEDNLQQIGLILDRLYDFIVLPVHDKLPQYMEATQYNDKIKKIEEEIYKLKQLFLKQEDNYKPANVNSGRDIGQKQPVSKGSSSISSEPHIGSKKLIVSNSSQQKSFFVQKLIDIKIVERLIMTIKAYESFRQQNQKQLEQIINFLKQKFNIFYDKFKQEYNKKKLPSLKDRIMLQKFENFQAYL